MTKHLDFVVIGAPKAGTTTLFHYMSGHPELVLPRDKEANFFTRADRFAKGWDAFAADAFAGSPRDRRWGKLTPQYLADPHVPARLAEHNPQLRLVALLRNPIDRSYSYFRMLKRQGIERRSFEQAYESMARRAAQSRLQSFDPNTRGEGYLVRSEYARCLGVYLQHFPMEQLRVYFTEELRSDPGRVVAEVFEHVGVDPTWVPENLDQRFNVGGDAQRFPWLVPLVSRIRPIRFTWRRLPQPVRKKLFLRFDTEVNIKKGRPEELSPELRARIRGFFQPDVKELEELLGRPVPWSEFKA